MPEIVATSQTILVVGGGVSGMTVALEAAECGKQVVLVERSPTLGGRTVLLYRYFPKAVPSDLRTGDQPAAPQGQPQCAGDDARRGDENRGKSR